MIVKSEHHPFKMDVTLQAKLHDAPELIKLADYLESKVAPVYAAGQVKQSFDGWVGGRRPGPCLCVIAVMACQVLDHPYDRSVMFVSHDEREIFARAGIRDVVLEKVADDEREEISLSSFVGTWMNDVFRMSPVEMAGVLRQIASE